MKESLHFLFIVIVQNKVLFFLSNVSVIVFVISSDIIKDSVNFLIYSDSI